MSLIAFVHVYEKFQDEREKGKLWIIKLIIAPFKNNEWLELHC